MKVKCIVSHELPGEEPGTFSVFHTGEEYFLDDFSPALFEPVLAAPEPQQPAVETTTKGGTIQ